MNVKKLGEDVSWWMEELKAQTIKQSQPHVSVSSSKSYKSSVPTFVYSKSNKNI